MNRYLRYIIPVVFIIAVLLIVFLQFISNRSINRLVNGNEEMLNGFEINNTLRNLQNGVLTMESKVKGTVIRGAEINDGHIANEISSLNKMLDSLYKMPGSNLILPQLAMLRDLVNRKINTDTQILDTFRLSGKVFAENIVKSNKDKQLTDSIRFVCNQIDGLHRNKVIAAMKEADYNGLQAKTLGRIIAIIAILASLFTFTYIAFKVKEQQKLIDRLNISEKKANTAVKIKENFLSNMSHEIRTPMNAILGFTALLYKKQMDESSKEYLQAIKVSGDNLLTIINDILDLSKIESGMMRIEKAPFKIREVINTIKDMLGNKAVEKNISLQIKSDDNIPEILEGDAVKLTQILVNLVGNAIKFTSKGMVSVQLLNKGFQKHNFLLGIIVSDTGMGIEKMQQTQIFERFQQADDTITRQYGGTGLGLSIVKDLVQLQNGTINVESEIGKGSSFILSIPYTISRMQTHTTAPFTGQTGNPFIIFENKRILIAEDNEINQLLLKHLLKEWNLDYDIALNGNEAIELLTQKNFDLILMDLQMPEMDGYTATKHIREVMHLKIPIIAITAHAMAGEREKCMGFGMNEYISKPLRETELLNLILYFIGKQTTEMPNV
ncbi:MAG: response regulator, partial [Ferruginibacter sp.]